MTLLQAAPALPAPARSRRALLVLPALVAVLLVVVAAWLWAGHHPQVVQGSYSRPLGLETADDGFVETRYVVPPDGGGLVVSVRNDGRLPVVVRAAPDDGGAAALRVEGFRAVPPDGSVDTEGRFEDAVRLGADEQALVRLRLSFDPCTPMAAGGSATRERLPLRVSVLGVDTVRDLEVLPLPVTYPGPVVPGPQCPSR